MSSLDAFELAAKQIARDRKSTARFPGLFDHKVARMQASPLAFLRGTAPLFYDLLRENRALAAGPKGEGWIVGDLHLENFGAYRPGALKNDRKHRDDEVVFQLNDFDDAIVGPHRLDMLRLATSFVLVGRSLGISGGPALAAADELIASYADHLAGGATPPPRPRIVSDLLEQARSRTRKELLDGRTLRRGSERWFKRGARYREVSLQLHESALQTFARYGRNMHELHGTPHECFEVMDVAFRLAGTGSLGSLRLAVLARGKGGPSGAWIFDMKSEGSPSPSILLGASKWKGADRVVAGTTACLAEPPLMLASAKLGPHSLLVRRLTPQEDKLDVRRIRVDEIAGLARYLGALTALSHRRGATFIDRKSWTGKAMRALVEYAAELAGVYEATYLAFCDRTR